MTIEARDNLGMLLWPLANKIALKRCHWIVTPDGDLGTEWCTDCGYFKVRNLRRHDRKRRQDYLLDGGWRTDHDHTPFCEACGELLDGNLTNYGSVTELEHYQEYGFSTNVILDAYFLEEMLCNLPNDVLPAGIKIVQQFCKEVGLDGCDNDEMNPPREELA